MTDATARPTDFHDARFFVEIDAFVRALELELDTGLLDRAWQITVGTVRVQGEIDFHEEDHASVEDSETEAWWDLWQAFEGKPASRTIWGLHSELLHACGPHADRFIALVQAAGQRADGAREASDSDPAGAALGRGHRAKAPRGKHATPIHRGHLTLLR